LEQCIGPDTLSNNLKFQQIRFKNVATFDTEAILLREETGRVIIYQEDSMFGGVASDISTHYGGML
jgi:2-oxoisovalerate dehydrogenase E1 component